MTEPATIRTKRMVLRPFEFKDVNDVFDYASDTEWSRFLPVANPYTMKDAEAFVSRQILKNWDERPRFAIELQGVVVGSVKLTVEAAHSIASLRYSIARQCWNRGLMTEALSAIVSWGFDEFGLEKICARMDVENVGSWRVMEKIGMNREGTLRSHGVNRGVRYDYHCYGILRHDWQRLPRRSPTTRI